MKFLTDNTTLVQFTPNVISPVEGEQDLYTKIHSFIAIAEAWFESRIATYEQLSALENSEELLTFARTAIASDAYRHAIPSLDVVLTANGFGIVSNQTIAPASRDRINALLDSLEAQCDAAIEMLMLHAPDALLLRPSLFRGYEAVRLLGKSKHLLQELFTYETQIASAENYFASHAISQDILEQLRGMRYTQCPAPHYILLTKVQCAVIAFIRGEDCRHYMQDMVDFIRKHPVAYPNWADSQAAVRWQDYTYKNDKSKGGFWL